MRKKNIRKLYLIILISISLKSYSINDSLKGKKEDNQNAKVEKELLGKNQNEWTYAILASLATACLSLIIYIYKDKFSNTKSRLDKLENDISVRWGNSEIEKNIELKGESIEKLVIERTKNEELAILKVNIETLVKQYELIYSKVETINRHEIISVDTTSFTQENFKKYIEDYLELFSNKLSPLIPATVNLAVSYYKIEDIEKANEIRKFAEFLMNDKYAIYKTKLNEIKS